MAGHARYTALLDACVLYPLAMTDALMSLATAGLYVAKWTTRIEQEWIRSLERQRPELVGRLTIRRDSMRQAVPDWEVTESAWASSLSEIVLPDRDDVHCLYCWALSQLGLCSFDLLSFPSWLNLKKHQEIGDWPGR
jgi:hypothetical protein